jgi:hypothetical protein
MLRHEEIFQVREIVRKLGTCNRFLDRTFLQLGGRMKVGKCNGLTLYSTDPP